MDSIVNKMIVSDTTNFPALNEVSMSLVLVLAIYFGLSRLGCDFALQILRIVIVVAVSSTAGPDVTMMYAANQLSKQLPLAMKTVLSRFNGILSDQRMIYACCPSCSCIYPPSRDSGGSKYPLQCSRKSSLAAPLCNTILLEKGKPIRPFILPDLVHFISKLLSNKEIEQCIDSSCAEGLKVASGDAPPLIQDPFQAKFLCSVKGPQNNRLFIDGGPEKEARLVFSLNVDWFNIFRSTNRGSTTSTGVMCLSCLNLPKDMRFRPEYMYVAIIPGPKVPVDDQMNHFLRPLVESIRQTFYQSLFLYSTDSVHNLFNFVFDYNIHFLQIKGG